MSAWLGKMVKSLHHARAISGAPPKYSHYVRVGNLPLCSKVLLLLLDIPPIPPACFTQNLFQDQNKDKKFTGCSPPLVREM